jgi:hypothetical protein
VAWVCALAAWLALGGLASGVEQAGIPSNHIARLIAADAIDTSVALRWRGRLREDPMLLPWGQRFEIDLEQVEGAGARDPRRLEMQGRDFDWDGVTGKMLWPADVSAVSKASNGDSLVMRIQDGAESFLLSGDIEKRVENEPVDEQAPLTADFLKVPHHGSKTSSTDAFVGAVALRVAVVSAGEGNPFGHPVDAVVQRYADAGVRFLRTDRDGAVTALTDGHDLIVHTSRKSVHGERGICVATESTANAGSRRDGHNQDFSCLNRRRRPFLP